jgi:hypothetical protein
MGKFLLANGQEALIWTDFRVFTLFQLVMIVMECLDRLPRFEPDEKGLPSQAGRCVFANCWPSQDKIAFIEEVFLSLMFSFKDVYHAHN